MHKFNYLKLLLALKLFMVYDLPSKKKTRKWNNMGKYRTNSQSNVIAHKYGCF